VVIATGRYRRKLVRNTPVQVPGLRRSGGYSRASAYSFARPEGESTSGGRPRRPRRA